MDIKMALLIVVTLLLGALVWVLFPDLVIINETMHNIMMATIIASTAALIMGISHERHEDLDPLDWLIFAALCVFVIVSYVVIARDFAEGCSGFSECVFSSLGFDEGWPPLAMLLPILAPTLTLFAGLKANHLVTG